MPGRNTSQAPRALVREPDETRCESRDPEHANIRCFKAQGHKLNWHEAEDTGGEVTHTWTDPVRASIRRAKAR